MLARAEEREGNEESPGQEANHRTTKAGVSSAGPEGQLSRFDLAFDGRHLGVRGHTLGSVTGRSHVTEWSLLLFFE